jgi:hypothetical protein
MVASGGRTLRRHKHAAKERKETFQGAVLSRVSRPLFPVLFNTFPMLDP